MLWIARIDYQTKNGSSNKDIPLSHMMESLELGGLGLGEVFSNTVKDLGSFLPSTSLSSAYWFFISSLLVSCFQDGCHSSNHKTLSHHLMAEKKNRPHHCLLSYLRAKSFPHRHKRFSSVHHCLDSVFLLTPKASTSKGN